MLESDHYYYSPFVVWSVLLRNDNRRTVLWFVHSYKYHRGIVRALALRLMGIGTCVVLLEIK